MNKLNGVSVLLLVTVMFMTAVFVFRYNRKEDKIVGSTIINITSTDIYELGEEKTILDSNDDN